MKANIARLAEFASSGQPSGYGGSDMMRSDVESLVVEIVSLRKRISELELTKDTSCKVSACLMVRNDELVTKIMSLEEQRKHLEAFWAVKCNNITAALELAEETLHLVRLKSDPKYTWQSIDEALAAIKEAKGEK